MALVCFVLYLTISLFNSEEQETEEFTSVPACLLSSDGVRWYPGIFNNDKCQFEVNDTAVYAALVLDGLDT